MPIMERAGSTSPKWLTYQCPQCHFRQSVALGRPGDRTYNDRIPCPRCTKGPGYVSPELDKALDDFVADRPPSIMKE